MVLGFVILPLFALIILGGIGGFFWAKSMLAPVDGNCAEGTCEEVKFTVSDGESKSIISPLSSITVNRRFFELEFY